MNGNIITPETLREIQILRGWYEAQDHILIFAKQPPKPPQKKVYIQYTVELTESEARRILAAELKPSLETEQNIQPKAGKPG